MTGGFSRRSLTRQPFPPRVSGRPERIFTLLALDGFLLHIPLDWIGTWPYAWRLFLFLLVVPPAFLMGFPMPVAMATLAKLRNGRAAPAPAASAAR